MKHSVPRPQPYLSFLVRLWKVDQEAQVYWRVSIEDPFTGERCGFMNLKAFIAFLEKKMRDFQGTGQDE